MVSFSDVAATAQRKDVLKWEKFPGKLADLTIITSDNPRFEEPLDIIEDIKTGISQRQQESMLIFLTEKKQ